MNCDIFRAYDIRGIFGVDFEAIDFYKIAHAFVNRFQPKTVALGHDVRESSPLLFQYVAEGLIDAGVKVLNLGQISTDMLYFAVVHYQTDGGIVISASHNPAEYNGMKLVRQHAAPISADTGLLDIRNAVENTSLSGKEKIHCRAIPEPVSFLDAYLKHLCSFTDMQQFSSQRIVINANSGLAGQIAERLLAETPIQICERLFTEPDGTFSKIPAGRPDPLRPENRELTTQAVQRTKADLAIAWDADADSVSSLMKMEILLRVATLQRCLPRNCSRRKAQGRLFLIREPSGESRTLLFLQMAHRFLTGVDTRLSRPDARDRCPIRG